MIPIFEIKSIARESGVPESTIERDYAQNWLLKNLASINMSLKGGTGIRKIYIRDYRFSDDLDFTLLGDLKEPYLQKAIADALRKAREESGINFEDEIRTITNDNGLEIHTYFRLLRSAGDPIRIKLDITKSDRELLILPSVKSAIIHSFSDYCNMIVNAYPLVEIFAEKVRAIFERTRPRDIYDVWYLHHHVSISDVDKILTKKCNFKSIQIRTSDFISKKGIFYGAWESSLKHQLRDLPDFNIVFDEVLRLIKKYE